MNYIFYDSLDRDGRTEGEWIDELSSVNLNFWIEAKGWTEGQTIFLPICCSCGMT
jgi:hypothetical protein